MTLKKRRHHNNKGERQVRRGKTVDQVKAMARRLGLKYKSRTHAKPPASCDTPSTRDELALAARCR
jgi:hypothetical protein